MRVTIKLYATLRRYKPEVPPGEAISLDVLPGTTVGQVVEQLMIPAEVPLLALVNGEAQKLDYMLADGDMISLFPPVAGG